MTSATSRRGRRPGTPDTRATILQAARAAFAAKGFSGTTIRSVAADAGVDAALVHHYFGTKSDLFVAAMELPIDPREVIARVTEGGPDGAGERLLRGFLSVWDDEALGHVLVATVRSAIEPGGERLLSEGFVPVVLVPAGQALGIDRPEVRMPLVAGQILGLVLARYLFRIEPVASMDADAVVAAYAPAFQHLLTGELG